MTEKKNKDFMRLLDSRIKSENDRKEEQGRSMVEMLGVLAIIGVLSVGSIAGYRYAMDNYYTNEILAGASQRAVLVVAQITAGQKISLAEFDKIETAGGTFGREVKTDIEGEFGITVTGVKESVCKNIIKATEDTDIILAKIDGSDFTEEDCSVGEFRITYSNDLGKGGEDTDPACADVTCEDGLTCVKGSCLCSDRMLPCKGACCGEGEICTAPGIGDSGTVGECVTPTGECATNADCGKGEFCLFTSYTSSSDAGTTCEVPANGVCIALTGSYAKKVVEDPKEPLYGVTYSDAKMNWWSASNWCQANKSSLMSLATLNTLSGLSASAMNETEDFKTARKTALQGGLGKTSGYVWLEDVYSSTTCYVRNVGLSSGVVGNSLRHDDRYALCR